MNRNCKCGGTFKTVDHYRPERYEGRTIHATERLFPGYATWQCFSCGKVQKQKLRVSKK